MAYSESLAQQVRAILATDLPPHVFEEEVEEKRCLVAWLLWFEVR